MPSQCNGGVDNSVCRCCCSTDRCNRPLLGCLNRNPQCNPARAPRFGSVECDNQPGTSVGTNCNFACNEGYELFGDDTTTCAMNRRTREARFDRPPPVCRSLACQPGQRAPSNGDVVCSDRNNIGSVCDFTCNEGYYLSGNDATTCGGNGEWDNRPPFCIRIRCPPPHIPPANGVVSCSDRNFLNSVCDFTCNAGYFLQGSPASVCEDDFDNDGEGIWSAPAPTCAPVTCPPPHTDPENGQVACSDGNLQNSRCRFACDEGYALQGEPVSICEDDFDNDVQGLWSSLPPVCVPLTCPPPHIDPDNGSVACSNDNFDGSECRFSCDVGFFLLGSQSSICRDDGDLDAEGEWSDPPPTCLPITCIPPQDSPENGLVFCSNANLFGSTCTFTCDPGFDLVGSGTTTCVDDSNDDQFGEWSEPPSLCRANACPDPPPAPDNGFIVCGDGPGFSLGSSCEYGCDPFHTRIGPLFTTCVAGSNGERSWNNPPPSCQPNRCPEQILPRGQVVCEGESSTHPETTCFFECIDAGYELFPPGLDENVCLNDTTWSIPRPCCRRPCPPFAVMDFVVVMDSSSSIGDLNWITMTDFVRTILNSFTLANDAARMSVFRYNRAVDEDTQILLSDFIDDQAAFINAFDNIPYDGRGTRTGNALRHARDVIFAAGNGNRPDVRDVMLVITDGRAQDDVAGIAQSLRDDGVLIYVLGVVPPRRGLDLDQLNDIAGNTDNVIITEGGFEGLTGLLSNQISEQICGDPCAEDPRSI
ncbi:P-selectin-like [Clavelina lepadiformis]|uniref:P-selectin-like n=1 Tax=Clavelina lepadiformis TaxID=159417 RepID=UPI00404192C3